MVKKVSNFWIKFELFINFLIPYSVLILLFIIIIDFFYFDIASKYHTLILILDNLIILVFLIDLIFKYLHLLNFKLFVRDYWLDILVIFPFFLFFRAIEEVLLYFKVSESVKATQNILHSGLEIQKEVNLMADEINTSSKFAKYIKSIKFFSRMLRLLKLIPYEKRRILSQISK